MFNKYLIVASKKDLAGVNITTKLSKFGKFDFYLMGGEIIHTENLDLEKINHYDFIIFASKHESKKKQKTLSIHAPGNWRPAEFGGERRKVCPSSAIFQKQMFETLNKQAKEYQIKDYNITLEATHHGPLIEKPCVFIEIGSTPNEWENRKAGFIIAKTISETIKNFKENPYREIAIGIGGPHYCPNFSKVQLNSNYAISHIIPQYSLPVDEEMVKEAFEKTLEEIDFVLLDWKGLGKSERRQQVLDVLDSLNIQYKKTSEVKK